MNPFRAFRILSAILLSVSLAYASGFRERERTYHVLHYALDLQIDDVARRVSGTVRMRLCPLRPLQSLAVDAEELTIGNVTLSAKGSREAALPFRMLPKTVDVTFPRVLRPNDTVVVALTYHATPRTGLFFVEPDSAYPDRPEVIWSQGEMEQNHFWFPCYDYPNDKATVEMRITVPERFVAVSNGALLETTQNEKEKTKTYFWYSAKPMASYLISVVVGTYVQVTDWYERIPVQYNVYPSERDNAGRSFGRTPDMIRFFSAKTGFGYPWAKYAQTIVPDFNYGGMENTSATTLTDHTMHNARAHLDYRSEPLVAHELAHQWFGDLLTCRNWSNAWLNEGFATYFQELYDEARMGRDEFGEEIATAQESLLALDRGRGRRATVTNDYIDPEDVFDPHIYARGACILNMLRFVMGDSLFWEGIRHYVDLYQYQSVSTDDFRHAMEEIAKQDLGWFFNEWTVHAGYPELAVKLVFDSSASVLHLYVDQTQEVDSLTPLFRMPVDVELETDAGSSVHRVVFNAVREQRIDIPCSRPPRDVVFDKGNWILKKLTLDKSSDVWCGELLHGDLAERRDALRALAPVIRQPEVFSAVSRAMRDDPFWGIRRRAAILVARSGEPDALRALAPAFTDSSAHVRAAATAGLRNFHTLDALVALGNILAHDSSEAVAAEAIQSLAAIDSAHAMKYCEKGMSMDSHDNIIRAAAVRAMGALRSPQAKEKLLSLTAYGRMQEVRLAAIDALADHWPADPAVRKVIEDLLHDPEYRIRSKAIDRLPDCEGMAAEPVLKDISTHDPQPLLRREARRSLARLDQGNVPHGKK